MSLVKKLLLALGSTVAALVFVTVVFQLVYEPRPVRAGWRSRVIEQEKNQLGFRGHPIEYAEDDYVVVLLGDSQVEAQACAYDWMPESRLQVYLEELGKRARVFTLGAGGYGQDQQLLALREYYRDHRADLVILWLTIENDIWNNVFPTHWPANGDLKPTFWLEDGELRGPSHEMDGADPLPSIDLVAKIRKEWFLRDRDGEWEELHLPAAYQPLEDYTGTAYDSWQDRVNRDPQGHNENLDNEKSHFSIYLTPPSPRSLYGLELTRKLIGEIERLVVSKNGRLIALRAAHQWEQSDDAIVVQALDGKYYETSQAQHRSSVEFVTEGVDLFEIPVTTENPTVGPTDSHLNQHAVDQVIRDLVARLADTIRVPSPR